MKTSIAALAIVLASPALGQTAPTPPATPAAPAATPATPTQPQPSPKAGPAIMALQDAIAAKDTANIPAKLAAAEAVATTPVDHYWIARVQLNGAIHDNNLATAQQQIDAIAATNVLPASGLADLYNAIGGSFYQAAQYDQAAAAFEKAVALAPTDPNNMLLVAKVRAKQGRGADAAAALQRTIAISKASGQKPSEDLYKDAAGLAYQVKSPDSVSIARDWLQAYPSDEAWRNSLAIYRNLNAGDPDNIIDDIRLARLTNAMQTADDYEVFAGKALDQQNFGEAKAVLDEGVAAGKLKASDKIVASMFAEARGKVPTAAQLAAAEKGAVVPNAFLRVGDRYYAAGNYAKAADLYRQALAKGVDPNLANLRLGEALARSGDKAGATAAFNAVSGSRSDLAKFWLLYIQTHA